MHIAHHSGRNTLRSPVDHTLTPELHVRQHGYQKNARLLSLLQQQRGMEQNQHGKSIKRWRFHSEGGPGRLHKRSRRVRFLLEFVEQEGTQRRADSAHGLIGLVLSPHRTTKHSINRRHYIKNTQEERTEWSADRTKLLQAVRRAVLGHLILVGTFTTQDRVRHPLQAYHHCERKALKLNTQRNTGAQEIHRQQIQRSGKWSEKLGKLLERGVQKQIAR